MLIAARNGRPLPPLAAQVVQAVSHRAAPPEPDAVPVLEAYGLHRHSGPDTVRITVEGTPYYVSGDSFTVMKDSMKAYAIRGGISAKRAFDPVAKSWSLPGTLADLQATFPALHISTDKPTSAAVTAAVAAGVVAPPEAPPVPSATPGAAGSAAAEAAGGVERSRYRLPPNAAPGSVPAEILEIANLHLEEMLVEEHQALVEFANGKPLDTRRRRAVEKMLSQIARDIKRLPESKGRTRVPLVYWARHYANSTPKQYALTVALLTAIGHARCPTCGQFLPAGGGHICLSPAFGPDGYNGFGVDRYGVTRHGTKSDGTPVPKRKTIGEAAKDLVVEADPINNPAMAQMWGGIAAAVAGHECKVVLREGKGFATDMQGTIYADPYPLGHDADPRHNLLVTKAGIYHEIGHELTTPPEDWAYLIEVAKGKKKIPGIDKSRKFITKMYNIIEDGRMERDMSDRFAGVAETLAAQCAIYPRWRERVGPGVALADEVIWPLLYTALPYFSVRDEVRAAMTPAGRKLFEELEPIARRGALGTTEESLAATIEITRRLEAAGIFEIPETSATAPPPPPTGTRPRSGPPREDEGDESEGSGAGKDAGDEGEESGTGGGAGKEAGDEGEGSSAGGGAGKDAGDEGKGSSAGGGAGKDAGDEGEGSSAGGGAGKKAGDEGEESGAGGGAGKDGSDSGAEGSKPSKGGGAGKKPDDSSTPDGLAEPTDEPPPAYTPDATPVGKRLTDARLEDILNDLEGQAVRATEREVTRQGRYEALGGLLHAPLTGSTGRLWDEGYAKDLPPADTTKQRYRAPDGTVTSVQTGTPMQTQPTVLADLERRRPAQQAISGRLARRLDSIRQESIARLRMQSEGRLDRRRLAAALSGREDVRTRSSVTQATGMAVSVLLDQSASMYPHIQTNQLYDATCIIGQALEQLDVPYEVRGHGGASTQYKAMDDATLDPRRAARLAMDDTSSNYVTVPVVGLATAALLGKSDGNKLIVNLMDGDMEDHEAAVTQYKETRKQGIVTFGVFLGAPSSDQQRNMTELFGLNNWRPIATLEEMPKVVGNRIADIFEALGSDT